jgi:hypothetical protein
MLNKKEFSLYIKELLAICGVVHKDKTGKELCSHAKNEDGTGLVDSVFGAQESLLVFIHDNKMVGEMVVFTTTENGQAQLDLGVFNCQELYVPNMLHFITSDDKDQENRASITKYLAMLLEDYSISFIDPDSYERISYERKGSHLELAENLFMREISCISIVEEGVELGTIHFAGEYNDKRDWQAGDPYDFLDVYAFSGKHCRALLPNKLLAA